MQALVLLAAAFAASADQEKIEVTVTGILHTGVVAIGAETTGVTITAKGVTWELDLAKSGDAKKSADKLDGKLVTVKGELERRPGVEIKERWIVTVSELRPAKGGGAKKE
jgi:hypothetical protein